jgi:hypothetical protein
MNAVPEIAYMNAVPEIAYMNAVPEIAYMNAVPEIYTTVRTVRTFPPPLSA